MVCYYTLLQSKTHAFLLERRMRNTGIKCELTFMPREITKDLCNMGIKFEENVFKGAVNVIKASGIPGCRLYREVVNPSGSQYFVVSI